MRIIAGTLKGRRLAGPTGAGVRPTSDGLRETLFNILGPSVTGARVLDGFAGTGAVGLEALSRGAAHVTFVERDRRALAVLRENIQHCGVESSARVVARDFDRAVAPPAIFDLILLDPPYDVKDLNAVLAVAAAVAAERGQVVLEHSRRRAAPDAESGLRRVRLVTSGDSALAFYAVESRPAPGAPATD
jgi:16S rRNA (guanine(966)-N(2))-methyltransferase RsmD